MKNSPYVVLNNKILGFDVPPIIEDGSTLVPMRFLFEQMGADVEWDSETQTATAMLDNKAVTFSIDNVNARINNKSAKMDVPARLVNGKTMVPLRFLSENMGYDVDWDADSRTAIVLPREHFLRKLEAALDLSFVYEETAPLYSKKYGRPAIDPVVIVKYLLVGFLYGIPSERQIERRVQTDIALRWYLGLDLFDRVPDHSTVSQLRRRKPSFRKVFRRLFEEVVGQCIEKGLVSGRVVGADSTHVRANASRASEELVEVAEEAGVYWERLDDYEEEGLEELERRTGKRRKKRTKQIKRDNRRTHKRVSRTDPESGHLKRPGKPEGPHYLAHQAVDSDYGIIVGQTVTAGDVNDSVPFLGLIEHIHENVVPIQAATADAAYDFPLAHRALGELGIGFFVRPQKTAARANTQFTRDDFCRDENRDVYLCPIGKELRLRRLARSASGLFWEYQADKRDCALCPLREKCLRESDKRGARKVSVSYFAADRQRNLERRSSPEYREALKLRQVWCEGSFSAQKREHNLARVLRRGLEAAEDHCLLSATALNLKRMIKHAG